MKARFRKDYVGEFVIAEIRVSDNAVRQLREWIPNNLHNNFISPRAAVIAGYDDTIKFDHKRLENHQGGLQGTKSLQTYGTGNVWTDMRLDFYISTNRRHITSLINRGYHKNTAVLTTPGMCLDNPGHLYLVPYNPIMDDLALAIYLAAFDGHTEIFLIGYGSDTRGGTINWIQDVNKVFQDYPECQFTILGTDAGIPELWRYNINVSTIKLRNFISYCDV